MEFNERRLENARGTMRFFVLSEKEVYDSDEDVRFSFENEKETRDFISSVSLLNEAGYQVNSYEIYELIVAVR